MSREIERAKELQARRERELARGKFREPDVPKPEFPPRPARYVNCTSVCRRMDCGQ